MYSHSLHRSVLLVSEIYFKRNTARDQNCICRTNTKFTDGEEIHFSSILYVICNNVTNICLWVFKIIIWLCQIIKCIFYERGLFYINSLGRIWMGFFFTYLSTRQRSARLMACGWFMHQYCAHKSFDNVMGEDVMTHYLIMTTTMML